VWLCIQLHIASLELHEKVQRRIIAQLVESVQGFDLFGRQAGTSGNRSCRLECRAGDRSPTASRRAS